MHESKRKMASVASVFGIFWRHTTRYPASISYAMLGTVVILAADLIGPLYLRQFFNALIGGAADPSAVRILTYDLLLFGAFVLLGWLGQRIRYFGISRLEIRVMSDLYKSSFDYLLRHSYHFFISRFAGSLTHRVSKYVRAYESLVDAISDPFLTTLFFIIGSLTRSHGKSTQ